jgi:uncharacterized membrane protein
MPQRKATIERLAVFSDGVFAVIITIMVLDLRPPEHPTFAALLPLWPTALSYAATTRLIWINFAHLFMVSLVPFATAWVASTRLAVAPVFVYAAVFVLVELAYLQFEHHALANAVAEISRRTRRLAFSRRCSYRSNLQSGPSDWCAVQYYSICVLSPLVLEEAAQTTRPRRTKYRLKRERTLPLATKTSFAS